MRLKREETAALFVDLQERLVPAMHQGEEVIRRNVVLFEGLKVLDVPAVFVRHYPKGLGEIASPLREAAEGYVPFDKIVWSATEEEGVAKELARLRESGVKNILVTGMESHVCVLQTCLALAEDGFQPVLVVDCADSRSPFEKEIGLRRAAQENVILTTVESILFELCKKAGTDEFKAISKLVK